MRSHGIDAVLVLGKELRVDAERARRELMARAAAASVAWRHGVRLVGTLESRLRGQEQAGSALVCAYLDELGVPRDAWVVDELTRSTREEVREARRLVEVHGLRRIALVTARYHLPRTRRYLRRVLPVSRAEVFTPESFLQQANALERSWIKAGAPSEQTIRQEGRMERWLSVALSPLLYVPQGERLEVALIARFRAPESAGGRP